MNTLYKKKISNYFFIKKQIFGQYKNLVKKNTNRIFVSHALSVYEIAPRQRFRASLI